MMAQPPGNWNRRDLIVKLGAAATAVAVLENATASTNAASAAQKQAPEGMPAGAALYSYDAFRAFHSSGRLDYDVAEAAMRYQNLRQTEFIRNAVICHTGPVAALEWSERAERIAAAATMLSTPLGSMPLDAYVRHPQSQIDGLIVLHRGRVMYEQYPRMQPHDRHLLNSVTKPFVGLCVALLSEDGAVDVTRSIDTYLPELKGSGWEGVRIRDILDQASGIDGVEDGVDFAQEPDAPIFRVLLSIYTLVSDPKLGNTFDIVRTLKRLRPPGTVYEYSSINSIVLAWLVERVANQPFATFVTNRIWRSVGAEHDAWIGISPFGAPGADGGMSVSLKDLARFGLLYTPSGRKGTGPRLISNEHLRTLRHGGRSDLYLTSERSKSAELQADPPLYQNWLWDRVWEDGDIYKNGWGGQGLHVATQRDGVIAFFGTGRHGNDGIHELRWLARTLSKQLFT